MGNVERIGLEQGSSEILSAPPSLEPSAAWDDRNPLQTRVPLPVSVDRAIRHRFRSRGRVLLHPASSESADKRFISRLRHRRSILNDNRWLTRSYLRGDAGEHPLHPPRGFLFIRSAGWRCSGCGIHWARLQGFDNRLTNQMRIDRRRLPSPRQWPWAGQNEHCLAAFSYRLQAG